MVCASYDSNYSSNQFLLSVRSSLLANNEIRRVSCLIQTLRVEKIKLDVLGQLETTGEAGLGSLADLETDQISFNPYEPEHSTFKDRGARQSGSMDPVVQKCERKTQKKVSIKENKENINLACEYCDKTFSVRIML